MITEPALPQLNEKTSKRLVVLLFCVILLLGLTGSYDYGINSDEFCEETIMLGNIYEYARVLFSEDSSLCLSLLDYNYMDSEVVPISRSIEKDHGTSVYYPLSLLVILDAPQLYHGVYLTYTFCFCFTALICLYFLLKDMFCSRLTAVFGVLMLILWPRFFAESHYNGKDIILLALLIDEAFFAQRAIRKGGALNVIMFSLCAALACNTKIIGIYFFGCMGLAYVLYMSLNRLWSKKTLLRAAAAVCLSLALYWLLTPAMWSGIADFFKYCLTNTFGFSRWDNQLLYRGTVYRPSSEPLPRSYLVVWMFLTVPVFISALALAGAVFLIKSTFAGSSRDKRTDNSLFFSLVFAAASLLPVLVTLVKGAVLYNGWRHFYFAYFGVLILAVYAVSEIMKRYRAVCALVISGFLIFNAAMLAANHPFEYAYFNAFAGKEAGERYDIDYWNISSYKVLRYLDDIPSDGASAAGLDDHWDMSLGLFRNLPLLPDGSALTLTTDCAAADYIVSNVSYTAIYGPEPPADCTLIKTFSAYGNDIIRIYKREK